MKSDQGILEQLDTSTLFRVIQPPQRFESVPQELPFAGWANKSTAPNPNTNKEEHQGGEIRPSAKHSNPSISLSLRQQPYTLCCSQHKKGALLYSPILVNKVKGSNKSIRQSHAYGKRAVQVGEASRIHP